VDFFRSILIGKKANLDTPLIGNINSLVGGSGAGILGSLFSQGGTLAGQLFGEGAANGFGVLTDSMSSLFDPNAGPVFSAANVAFTQAGKTAGGIFGQGLIGSVNSFLGNLPGVGGLFSGLTSFGQSLGGSLASAVGGGFGNALGGILSSALSPVGLAAGLAFAIPSLIDLLFPKGRIQKEKEDFQRLTKEIFGEKFKVGLFVKPLRAPIEVRFLVKPLRAPPIREVSHDARLSRLSKGSANGKKRDDFGEGGEKTHICIPVTVRFSCFSRKTFRLRCAPNCAQLEDHCELYTHTPSTRI
jgi:hypothetical protein